ncbi:MAG TPA: hypothetical protein VL860_07595, partial [Planctomycetota bacterium]|nr:hypothetical protein [Planctomycetota bacterium]
MKILLGSFLACVGLVWGDLVSGEEPGATETDAAPAPTSQVAATSVSTFHCLSLYWSPEKGEAGKKVLVKFREDTEKTWHDGLALRYNPVKAPECKADY